jgi:hypothetical protein
VQRLVLLLATGSLATQWPFRAKPLVGFSTVRVVVLAWVSLYLTVAPVFFAVLGASEDAARILRGVTYRALSFATAARTGDAAGG